MRSSAILLLFCLTCFAETPAWKWLGPEAGNIQLIVPDRSHPGVWYVDNNGRFYRSTDGGRRWSATTIFNLSSVGAEYFDSLGNALPITVHPISSEVLAITASDYGSRPPWKLWSSSDYGKTFHLRGQFPFRLRKVLFHPKYREVVYGFGLPKY